MLISSLLLSVLATSPLTVTSPTAAGSPAFSTLLSDEPGKGATLTGTVLDRTGKPVEGVLITVGPRTVVTDPQGVFRLYGLPTGEATVTVSGLSIRPVSQTVTLQGGQVQTIQLTIEEAVQELAGVTVAAKSLRFSPEVDGNIITAGKKNEVIELDKLDANLVVNSARQVFAKVPGLTVWESDGSGQQINVAARGLSPNRSWEFNTRQNGMDISSDPMGYPEAYYNPPLEAVERIQIIRGGGSLQYGPQFGGMLNYELKHGPKDKKIEFETSNSVGNNGLVGTYNSLGGTVGKISYFGYYQQRLGGGWRDNSEFNIRNFHGNVQFQATSKLRLGAEISHLGYEIQQPGGLTDAQFYNGDVRSSSRGRNWFSTPWTIPAFTADYQFSERTRLSLKTFGLIGERNSIGLASSVSIDKPDAVNPATGQPANRQLDRDRYRNLGSELRLLTDYGVLGQQHTLAAGVRVAAANLGRRQQGTGDTGADFNLDLQAPRYGRDLSFRTRNYAAFVENIFRVGSRLTLTPGVRLELIDNDGRGYLSLNADGNENRVEQSSQRRVFLYGAGAELRATAQTSFYANYSRAFRPVTFGDLTPPATSDVIDPNLKDARGYNAEVGYRGSWGNVLTFDVDGFWLHYDDRIGIIRRFVPGSTTATQQLRTNIGTSVNKGVEAYVELDLIHALTRNFDLPHFDVFASTSFVDARYTQLRTTTLSGSSLQEGDLKKNRVEYAPKYTHRFGGTFAHKGFSATAQLTRVAEVFTDANNTVLPNAAATTGRVPGYSVTDLSATYRFAKRFTVRGGLNNVFDKRYFTRRSGGYPGPGILPADGRTWFASVGVKL
ncbi:Fe(3+) dicitrate transport protein [Hymenobacter daecheongensis DSM 21074]|uniref:Fe(3+) dicitrate transport protein n=1 Tax=Hymenobacter daecheongensis DSM 21074 TaxID=1121955 RepID=A0A1M6D4D7_9BACT|nr:TonB-dependent receptor [Hymenobacter daecheongensis]SHI68107.1 Fe(3+) dicitrate transport protein [Hymenobacter daecheongensis DSM 21074]